MIVVVENNNGYSIATNGQVLKVQNEHGRHVPAQFAAAELDELRSAVSVLKPVSTGAVTPAKAAARMRPPIQRYPVNAEQ